MSGTITLSGKAALALRVTTVGREATVWDLGRLVYDTDQGIYYIGDGETLGGVVAFLPEPARVDKNNQDMQVGYDVENHFLLRQMVVEMRKMNEHLAMITGEEDINE